MKKTPKTNKRISKNKSNRRKVVVAVSGGFDPIHVGHVRMIQEAAKLGHELVVILNNDNWLRDKKGFAFMPENERKEIIEGIRGVTRVVVTDHAPGEYYVDRSVCRTLRLVSPHIFANGGDRKPDGDPAPEHSLCEEIGIKPVYNVGSGGKVQSSSWLLDKYHSIKKKLAKTKTSASKKQC